MLVQFRILKLVVVLENGRSIHTISSDEIRMLLHPPMKQGKMPADPSHATLTIETTDPDTNQSEIKRFHCEYDSCSRSYSTVGNLRMHMKTHKGTVERGKNSDKRNIVMGYGLKALTHALKFFYTFQIQLHYASKIFHF